VWGVAVAGQRQARISFGTFEVDRESGELLKRGSPLRVQEKPLQLLLLLLEHPGEIVLREDLQRRLWPNGTYVDFDKGLNTAVKKLRYALGDSPDKPVFIETVPRRGYRFIAPVSSNGSGAVSASATASDEVLTQPASDGNVGQTRWVKRWHLTAFLLVSSAIFLFAGWWLLHRQHALQLQGVHFARLTQNGRIRYMAISPDGRRVAFALQDGLHQSLWIREIATGIESQLLAPDTVNIPGIEFSPDGNFVYFGRSEKTNPVFGYLCRIPAKGGAVVQLIRDADSTVSFSPDGRQFVFTRGYPPRNLTELRIADANGTNDHLLLSMSGHQVYEAGATWSPNNDVIAVPLHLVGERSRFVLDIVSLTGAHVREIYSSQGAIGRPLWIRSGKELLLTLEDANTHRGQLWSISYPDGKARRFTNDLSDYSSAIDVTADGTKLATIVSSIVSNLWQAGASDLSHPVQLTSGEPSFFQVRELSKDRLLARGNSVWTIGKDGTNRLPFAQLQDPEWIEGCGDSVLTVENKNGSSVLTRLHGDGSSPMTMASGDVMFPACSPDGRRIYYLNLNHPEKIRRVMVDDGTSSDVADVLGDTLFGNLTISPDGKLLAYPYQQYDPPLVALAVIPADDGGAPVATFRVPGFLGPLRWSPKGDSLQYLLTRNDATNLWEQPMMSRAARQLTKFNAGQIFDFSWSNDHQHLFLARGQVTRDVVLLEDIQTH
jgi:DNA-binding winged helix-turn-helix (wHTH) protein/Tol biopolymer transport system component